MNLLKIKPKIKISIVIICFMFFSATSTKAQKGLFGKFSLGVGYSTEVSSIKKSGLNLISKNHAIGWGITDKFAVKIGEFGGLFKVNTGKYNFINLDAYGVGASYKLPFDIKISSLLAYGTVSFAKKWYTPTGDKGGQGYGANLSIEKEWFIARHWGVRVGPQFFWIKTVDTGYNFFNASINASIVFYLTPLKGFEAKHKRKKNK